MRSITTAHRKYQGGFFMSLSVMFGLMMLSIILALYLNMKLDNTNDMLRNDQAKDIVTFVAAVRHAISTSEALEEANESTEPFHDGSILEGSKWLKNKECGGKFDRDFIFCSYTDTLSFGDNAHFETSISNDGTLVKAQIKIIDRNGYGFFGEKLPLESCEIAWRAKARDGLTNAGDAISDYTCDQKTGVITIKINFASDNSEYLSRHGKNSPTTSIDWAGQDLENVDKLSTTLIKDNDDNSYYIDMNGKSVLNSAEITKLNAEQATTKDLNVSNTINQTNANQMNSIAGGLSVGNTTNKVSMENGSVYLTGSVVSESDNSLFLDPNTSRVQDIRLASRGGVRISALLPKYVNEGSVTINGQGIVNKIACPEVGIKNLRIVVSWQDQVSSIAKDLKLVSNQTKKKIRIVQNDTQYVVQMMSYDFKTLSWKAFPENRGLVTLFCYYP